MRSTVAVVIPVFNEETAIGHVVSAIPRHLVDEIIVVDGGSRDRTAEVARESGARVLVEQRRGYGRACATGAQAARSEILAFLDGDGSDDSAALGQLLELVTDRKVDLALGARGRAEAGALPAHAVLGNRLAAGLISARWGQPITDLPSFKVIRRDKLLALNMTEATYGWTIEMIVKAARRGYRLAEVPLDYRRRMGGESKVSGNLSTSLKASYAILSTLARHGFGRSRGEPLIRRRALVLMAKAPIPGQAKTRLAATLGAETAARIHEAFLRTSLRTAREVCDVVTLMGPDQRHAEALRPLAPNGVHVWAQQRPGLMAGISEAFEQATASGASDVVVGETDSPNLPLVHLQAAFQLLERRGPGIVLGPCADGGYYLVGVVGLDDATTRTLFEGEAYDSSTICQRTAERARSLGLWVELAPEWYDVDTINEFEQLRAELEAMPDGQFGDLRAALAGLEQEANMLGLGSRHATH
ncbi:MAG: TIGR04282 family arsenosugar biosynthesis glycosyltransferase [Chloroflexota bacterium]